MNIKYKIYNEVWRNFVSTFKKIPAKGDKTPRTLNSFISSLWIKFVFRCRSKSVMIYDDLSIDSSKNMNKSFSSFVFFDQIRLLIQFANINSVYSMIRYWWIVFDKLKVNLFLLCYDSIVVFFMSYKCF